MKPFQMKIFQWRYSLFLLPVALWLPVENAQAAPNVTCTAGMNTAAGSTGIVNISDAVTPANADSAPIGGTLNYSCTNNGASAVYVLVHLGVDGGDSATLNPHYMSGPSRSKLAFTMTLPSGALWGNGNGSEYHPDPFLISPSETVTRSVVIKTALLSGYHNARATEGVHVNNSYITLMYDSTTDSTARLNYRNGDQAATQFPFTVQATVVPSCEVTSTSDIKVGSYPASRTNITGKNINAIGVTCTNDAPYYIGLTPSNDKTNGAGVMKGTPGNSDEVPYQLRSTSGTDGTIWGNTATSRVEATGNGAAQPQTVYVTVPSADVKPGNYSDTVTISVNY